MHQHTPAPPGDSDARLLEVLHGAAPGTPADPDATAVLLARHWQALYSYTALFTPSGRTAGMAAAAAFARLATAPPDRRRSPRARPHPPR
ncbi:hypothetical protein [Streptomyces sp. CC210A]|uniref:hypothetical protein n=1 Tax=Streptomyces sp. CC210A TaxID=2898184 RepID=UPI001F3411B3|nr:hypothetical protein [Streptomyces sp. CC210A]